MITPLPLVAFDDQHEKFPRPDAAPDPLALPPNLAVQTGEKASTGLQSDISTSAHSESSRDCSIGIVDILTESIAIYNIYDGVASCFDLNFSRTIAVIIFSVNSGLDCWITLPSLSTIVLSFGDHPQQLWLAQRQFYP